MVNCGHQLGDDGWLLCSSAAAPVGGNHETNSLLHRIMKELKLTNHVDFLQSRRMTLSVAKEREVKFFKHRQGRLTRRHQFDSFHDFSDFDETEHFDGCPVKWLFRRQSTENWSKTDFKTVRDKIPKEIQIRKIGLKKRKNSKENETEDKEENWKETAAQRAKLAAKLNFRPFSEQDDENPISDEESKFNLPNQRLFILLAPKPENFKNIPKIQSPVMSVRSLILPEIAKPRPKTATPSLSAQRWAGKKRQNFPNDVIRFKKNSIQIISSQVQFSQRPGKPMR